MPSKISVFLPDGSSKDFDKEPTGLELARSVGKRLAQDALGFLKKGTEEVFDIRDKIEDKTQVTILTSKDEKALEVIRHSAAHVLAQAVQELWPEVKVGLGPVIEEGFFYDFDTKRTFSSNDMEKIEEKMREIIKRKLEVKKETLPSKEAISFFAKMKEDLKVEVIKDLGEKKVSLYHQGDWVDLCRGPHVQNLDQIPLHIKVLSVAGAYWRGDENNKQLQRIYATAFFNKKDLEEHLQNLEEAKKRDHRKIGKELDLFHFHDFSPGSPFFTPKGTFIYNELQDFIREKYKRFGYEEIITPQLFDVSLYKKSGHYENYKEFMYFTDENTFSFKPMNCPGHCLFYSMKKKSYRELPWKVADFGRLHRFEKSGTMHGLNRVRSFQQDDAHIFCTEDQISEQVEEFMEFLKEVYITLGLDDYKVFFSTRPKKKMGSDKIWDKSEKALEKALKNLKLDHTLNPGEGAFYGPKLDVMVTSPFKKTWQLGTLQCDFNLPEKFKLSYISSQNKEERPLLIHRAVLGSLERFIGVYLEHTGGRLPTWLSPHQVVIMNITDSQMDYCKELEKEFKDRNIRVLLDDRKEKLSSKIRDHQLEKIPYLLVIGDKEKDKKLISIRYPDGKTHFEVKREEFYKKLEKEIKNKDRELVKL